MLLTHIFSASENSTTDQTESDPPLLWFNPQFTTTTTSGGGIQTNTTDHSPMNGERNLHKQLPVLLIFSFQLVPLNFRRSVKHKLVLHGYR